MQDFKRPTDFDYLQANAVVMILERWIAEAQSYADPTGAVDAQIIHATRAVDALRRTWGIQTEAEIDAAHEAATHALDELIASDPGSPRFDADVPKAYSVGGLGIPSYDSRADEYRTRGA